MSSKGELPLVLVLGSPQHLEMYEEEFTERFQILRDSDSGLPLDQFLASPQAQSATAMLSYGRYPLPGEIIRQLPSLRIIVTTSTGVNHIDVAECRRRGIAITTAGDAYCEDAADMAVGLLMDVLRKISAADRYVRNGNWPTFGNFPLASKLSGKRIGIIGMGRIGYEIAKRLEAFGCKISYYSRKKKDSTSYRFYGDLYELAIENDVLIICCSLNNQTRHMINGKIFSALGKDGIIINVARGPIINEEVMIQYLERGEIGGVGLDVFEHEPNVPQVLFGMDNVVLSPHNAVFTFESCKKSCDIIIGNLEAFFLNKPLLFELVDQD